ncbi:MAG: FAD:protein FMN transferase [Bacteroidaceae bacterium]|nr:FAD:protein FMN transferase [Bacteroidaceae bacterium]
MSAITHDSSAAAASAAPDVQATEPACRDAKATRAARPLKIFVRAAFLLFLIAGTVWAVRRHANLPWQADEGAAFGTYYHATYRCADNLHDALKAELARIDASLSLFNKESLLTRLNSNATDETDTLFRTVFRRALQVSEATGGAFDITVGPLVKAWGFGPDGRKSPTDAAVDSLRAFVGYTKVSLVGTRLAKADPRVQIDLGAIAKGFAVDRLAAVLAAHGVEDYMVEIGGEIVARGVNRDAKPWTVGVVRPTTEDAAAGALQTVVALGTGAVATSGNYLNFYKAGGQRVAHTIDPRTGRPAAQTLLSATVVAPDCATADAFATAFMTLGLDSARAITTSHRGLEALLIHAAADGTMQVWQSDGFPREANRHP